jgi:SAM-dependent methyltransferase
MMERRKHEEVEFHNRLRDASTKADPDAYRALIANKKYYTVAHASMHYYKTWLAEHCRDKVVLDFGCGDGEYSLFLLESGARRVVGVDISDVSIENCRRKAAEAGGADRAEFHVMDCEALSFPDDSFDIVCEAGVLHHLDLDRAVAEMARVVRPHGRVICYEAVGHNPIFQLYRRLTPQLRTQYETEHILKMRDVRKMRRFFGRVDVRFFHLLALLGVPFRAWPGFGTMLRALEAADRMVLSVPGIRAQAWMMIFEMSAKKQPSRA